jgi:hypothetical protein
MDKDLFAKKSSKALGSHNILVKQEFLSNDYCELIVLAEVKSLDNGHLELLRIEPRRTHAELPTFSVRWDHWDRKDGAVDVTDGAVDVDLLGSKEEAYYFKAGKSGYRGHKTKRLDYSSRVYSIDIETPNTGLVFKGTITLNIDLAESMDFRVSSSIECSAQVIRNGKIVDKGK